MQNIIHSIISNITEAKIGDKVMVHAGTQKGLVGHVGEIRKGLGGRDHTYTIDYDDNGKRSSVQVKKAHVKRLAEANDELNKKTPTQDEIMAKHGMSETEFNHHLQIGIKVEMEHTKNPMVAKEIAMDHLAEKPDYYAKLKKVVEEVEPIVEISKRLAGRYIEKAATSMSNAAFGQGQASAQYKPPSEKDQKTGYKRMVGIARAVSKLTKEETEQIDELSKSTLGSYVKKASLDSTIARKIATDFEHRAKKAKKQDMKDSNASLSAEFQNKSWKRQDNVNKAVDRLTKEEVEQVNEAQSPETLKKMSDYHFKQQSHHDKKALDKSLSVDVRKAHAMARAHHANAGENYLKASRDDGLNRDRYVDRAENHADAAEEHERKHHDIMEQELLAVGDALKQSQKNLAQKKSREAYIHHKDREARSHHMQEEVTPHAVEINLTHPQVDGPTYKNVKINAQSVKQATKLVSDHYTKRGFKVKDVVSAKPHKMPATPSPEAQAKEQEKEAQAVEKKENNTINKIAKAIKGAVK